MVLPLMFIERMKTRAAGGLLKTYRNVNCEQLEKSVHYFWQLPTPNSYAGTPGLGKDSETCQDQLALNDKGYNVLLKKKIQNVYKSCSSGWLSATKGKMWLQENFSMDTMELFSRWKE